MVLRTCIALHGDLVELKELVESHDFQCLDPLLRLNVVLLPGLTLNRFGNERSFHFIEVSSEKALQSGFSQSKVETKTNS